MRSTLSAWHFVIFFTLATGPLFAENQKPIETQASEKTEEEVWATETTTRNEHLYPSIWGQVGIFRVRSGYTLPEGAITFGIGGEFYSVTSAPDVTGTGAPTEADTIAESLFVGYAPTPELTLSLMRRNSSTTFNSAGTPAQLASSLGDFTFGGAYRFDVSESWVLTPLLNLMIASNFNSLAPSGQTLSGGVGVATTFNMYSLVNLPIFLHGNLLYHSPQISSGSGQAAEKFYGFTRFHSMTLGIGAEWHIGDFIPFFEYYNTLPFGSAVGLFSAPSKITVGTRLTPFENKSLAFLAGFDVGTGRTTAPGVPYTPPVQFVAQVSYTTGMTNSERKHYYTTSDVNVVNRKFIIKKNINFKVGKAELEPSSTTLLNQIADVILKNQVKKLLIVGHTDSSHNDEYNLKLSLDRANTVKRYLVSKGVAEETLMAQGYGKRKPRASNATESGRALNRRVEFFILE